MTAEVLKYTLEQVEALEIAPGTEAENLEGWIPELADEVQLRVALEKAFSYRGDITLTLKNGEQIEPVLTGGRGRPWPTHGCADFAPNAPEKRKLSYAEIARLEFTGKDRAAGKHWEDWVKKYNEKKAAGEKNIGLVPDALE